MTIKEQLLAKLEEINTIVVQHYAKEENTGVLAGLSGIAMFQFYYSRLLDVDTHADLGLEMLSECIDKINEGYNYPTYCAGIAGMGWVLDHLSGTGMMDGGNDELLSELDDFLYSVMLADMEQGNYDFLHGAIGYGFYFLSRYEKTESTELKKGYAEKILVLVEKMEALSEVNGESVRWLSLLNLEGARGYNLSLSHGISSIINFFARLYPHEIFREKVDFMLKGAIHYIRSFKATEEDAPSIFPAWITPDHQNDGRSRVAWCYGDLGIAISLWRAAKVLNDVELGNQALEVLRHTAQRKTEEETHVVDASICHGSYGNAQLFNRMYKETKEEVFRDAALFWIKDGLDRALHKDGYAGYKQWRKEEGWSNELSVLEGVAGIGLTIIDFLTDYEYNWDECLMLS